MDDPSPGPAPRSALAPTALAAVRIVLSEPRHPGNIGAAARAMKTMGLGDLRLVRPERYPDPEAERRASGARDVLAAARVCPTLEDALGDCVTVAAVAARPRDLAPPCLSPREIAPRLLAAAAQGPVALVFGGETNGLTRAEVGRCDWLVRIPTDAAYGSLNLGAAVQVLCYEMRLAALDTAPGSSAAGDAEPRASHAEVVRLLDETRHALEAVGFLDPARPGRLAERLERLARRAAIEPGEMAILRGAIAAVRARLPGGPYKVD
jgi:TrmH family RNA methyltransferase